MRTLIIMLISLWMTSVAQANTLYQQLGEKEGIEAIMTEFVLQIAEDERVIEHFENADIERFHKMITLHVCELVGGPCKYDGANMVEVHRGMQVERAEFNAIVEDLITAMEKQNVPVSAQNQLLAILAEFHDEIVQAPSN